jgi:hydroxymethylpyrimidine/phosphomethylpyrimidine kinase
VKSRKQTATALTIAGSDSGGGAGIQADLKTFASLNVHGTSALTCVTAQNPVAVRAVQACTAGVVRSQIEAVFAEFRPGAAKTGMLYSARIIEAVAGFFQNKQGLPLVVDPVMVATSGACLLKPSAIRKLCGALLPLATLITPNLAETELLLGMRVRSVEALRQAARELHWRYSCAVLAKGGHLTGLKQAVDIFYDGQQELLLSATFVRGVNTHGTGCTYSAAITGYLARGLGLSESVTRAKEYITQAIARSYFAGKHSVLNSFWKANR